MKKLLIIQRDSSYFLYETLQTLEKNLFAFKDFSVTLLAAPGPWRELRDADFFPLVNFVTTDQTSVAATAYDVSINLSMDELSWRYHGLLNSKHKLGPSTSGSELQVTDLWSTYLLTLKAGAPFLTFHLQDIFRNILGIKAVAPEPVFLRTTPKYLVTAPVNEALLAADDATKIIDRLRLEHQLTLRSFRDIDPVADHSRYVYLGPANLESLRLCENGAHGIFLTSQFQGMNLIPYQGRHNLISSDQGRFTPHDLYPVIARLIRREAPASKAYPTYELVRGALAAPYWRATGLSDPHYPIYQAHLVLWNFLLRLVDFPLEVTACSPEQSALLRETRQVLAKVLRLHEYALASLDIIVKELKLPETKAQVLDGHLANLQDMDRIFNQLSASNSLLRPFLDFYKLRKSQVESGALLDQAQDTFLTYTEEHHALTALDELFSVTLKKNEVNI